MLDGTEPAGRRLDFPTQELKREANMLSSKSQDDETMRAAAGTGSTHGPSRE
jgi:uncharacterized protein YicC (UPF0701 family)